MKNIIIQTNNTTIRRLFNVNNSRDIRELEAHIKQSKEVQDYVKTGLKKAGFKQEERDNKEFWDLRFKLEEEAYKEHYESMFKGFTTRVDNYNYRAYNCSKDD